MLGTVRMEKRRLLRSQIETMQRSAGDVLNQMRCNGGTDRVCDVLSERELCLRIATSFAAGMVLKKLQLLLLLEWFC